MSACPRCQSELRPLRARVGGGEECRACGMAWLDGGLLTNVVGAAARGKRRCRGCGEALGYTPNCASCGELPLGCPACGRDLLTVTLHGVAVEVCDACEGVLLDPGELAELQGAAAMAGTPARAESREAPPPASLSFTTCKKPLRPEHAFGLGEGAAWCGSCAPAGAHQLEGELSRKASNVLRRNAPHPVRHAGGEWAFGVLDGVLTWLFR
ncbi:MAG: zf-TFIIB domain-containing protein [Deltaproteobacteria bacterium]|nr:zf-TFIIB domain-containing protein [Deltaproteobacteria bacterium]